MCLCTSRELKISQCYDVLVIGSGIAGISAAIAAGEAGARVAIVCKGNLFSGSSFYPNTWGLGLIGPADSEDEPDLIHTIERVGCGVTRRELVESLVRGISSAISHTEEMGVKLRKTQSGGNEKEYIPCFDHKHRAWNGLEADSCREVFSRKFEELNIQILAGWEALELVKNGERVCGAVFSNGQELQYLGCKALVLATGGYGSLFQHHLCTTDVEGVGQSLALDAGCSLINMEFMQIMPGYLSPAYGTVFNEKVFRFSRLEHEHTELLNPETRDKLLIQRSGHGPFTSRLEDRAVDIAIQQAENGVRVSYTEDLKQNPPEFVQTYFDWLERAKGLTMDDSIQIGLFSHAANGGICIDACGATEIPGLYAAGEVTGGMHGADRIGGLSTANGLVFGGKAGTAAAAFAITDPEISRKTCLEMTGADDCGERFRKLQQIMTQYVMVCRNEEGQTHALEEISRLAEDMPVHFSTDISEITQTWRLRRQLQTAECIVSAAMLRRESRGSHYRTDYPEPDDRMKRCIRIRKENCRVVASFDVNP